MSKNGLKKIVKIQNLSLNELEQIEKFNNLLLNILKQIAKTRRIKTCKNTSRDNLLIAFLKSNTEQNFEKVKKKNNKEIEETKKLFSELRNIFFKRRNKKDEEKFSF